MNSEIHVIFGTGPAGCWIARALRDRNIPVRAVNKSGKRPSLLPEDVELVTADASDTAQAIDAAGQAAVVYQVLNPPYHQWNKYFPGLQAGAVAAAQKAEARYVSIENLYMYDASKTINETSPVKPLSKKGKLRAQMSEELLNLHRQGEIQVTVLRASDYYGPGVMNSALGGMVFGHLVAGKKAQLLGSAICPHAFAYIEDVGRAAAVLGTNSESLGKIWIAPHCEAQIQRDLVEMACRLLDRKTAFTVISPLMVRLAGIFIPAVRASVEMMYEFTEPFEVDSSRIEQMFSLQPVPLEEGIEKTIQWYKQLSSP